MNEQTATEQATAPATRTRKGKLVTCKCRDFEAHVMVDGSDPDTTEIETTGCDRQTNRLFAQGHDAKLVSFLVAAELAGHGIAWGRATGVLHTGDAVLAARQISDALAAKTQKALNKAEEKAIARQARQDTKARVAAEKKTAKAKAPREVPVQVVAEPVIEDEGTDEPSEEPTPEVITAAGREAKIKVGRWTYDAIIDNASGIASYKTKLGGSKVANPGEFTEVA